MGCARKDHISGEVDWQAKSYTVTGSGTHTLRWRYIKNSYATSGSDCGWVDYVQTPVPADWQTITYTYDPSGRRIAKSYDGQVVAKYLYDGPSLIAEYDGFNNLLRKYIYGPGIDQPICMIDVQHSNATYYYHFDGLGSVIALSDSSGDTAEVYEYSIFGEVSASDPTNPNPFLFTGREFDKETGLYYYRARYYNPYIGRFLQTDPAGQGMNLYMYCKNNPLCWVDHSGLEPTFILPEDGVGPAWSRGSGFPQLPQQSGYRNGNVFVWDKQVEGFEQGPYFIQSYNMSCAAVAMLNVWLSVGRKLPNTITKDWQAEDYACSALTKVHSGLNWNTTGIWEDEAGFPAVADALGTLDDGTQWTLQTKAITVDSIAAAIRSRGYPIIVAIHSPWMDPGTSHCVVVAKTPKTYVDYLVKSLGGCEADWEFSVIQGNQRWPFPGGITMLQSFVAINTFLDTWLANRKPEEVKEK